MTDNLCNVTHGIINLGCELQDTGDAHKRTGHRITFEEVWVTWPPSTREWGRWVQLARDSVKPEYDHDPTRRMSMEDLVANLTERRRGHGSPAEVKVVVATGVPGAPMANVMALSDAWRAEDGAWIISLEL